MSSDTTRALPPEIEPARAARLSDAAELTGARWAESELSSLRAAGRKASGGWPGTLSQARDYVSTKSADFELSYEELTWMARAVYNAARRTWLSRRDSSEE